MVTRGFASESIVQSLAEETRRSGKPKVILSLSDYDPSGSIMLQDIISRATHYAPDAIFISERVALTRDQVNQYRLPTRPTKTDRNSHAKSFGDEESVELDAMEPDDLRSLLQDAIVSHMDPQYLDTILAAEESEKQTLLKLAQVME